MARQAQNGFSKFDITKSKAMRNIEDIYDSESSAAEEPEKTETQTVDLESTEENAPAAKQEPAEETPAEQTPAEKKKRRGDSPRSQRFYRWSLIISQ